MTFFAPPNTVDYPWPTPGSLGDTLYNTNWDTAYQRLMEQYGYAYGQDPQSQFMRGLAGRSQTAYEAALPQNGLGYTYTDFLKNNFPKIFESAWGGQTPNQQGLNSSTPGIGRTRYVGWPTG
jgi:hypothetical protein